jgi:hypothetical protein
MGAIPNGLASLWWPLLTGGDRQGYGRRSRNWHAPTLRAARSSTIPTFGGTG